MAAPPPATPEAIADQQEDVDKSLSARQVYPPGIHGIANDWVSAGS